MNKTGRNILVGLIVSQFFVTAYATGEATSDSKISRENAELHQEGAGAYIDDSVITTKVKAALLAEADLKSLDIKVETYRGLVQLSGSVNSKANIKRAAEVASKVKGVKGVSNDLQLR